MAEGNEYLYLRRFRTMEEVDKSLEEIAKEGAVKRFFERLYRPIIEYFSKK